MCSNTSYILFHRSPLIYILSQRIKGPFLMSFFTIYQTSLPVLQMSCFSQKRFLIVGISILHVIKIIYFICPILPPVSMLLKERSHISIYICYLGKTVFSFGLFWFLTYLRNFTNKRNNVLILNLFPSSLLIVHVKKTHKVHTIIDS